MNFSPPEGHVNICLRLSYDGSAYCGWQRQPNVPTVQAALEEAMQELLGSIPTLVFASRTDTGVHALDQVVSCWVKPKDRLTEVIVEGCKRFLPDDIQVLQASMVGQDFHANYSVVAKTYAYAATTAHVFSPLKGYVWRMPKEISFESLCSLCELFIGEKNFAAFKTGDDPVKSTIRSIEKMRWVQTSDKIWVLQVRGDGFLRHMIRNMVGCMFDVAAGKVAREDVERMLSAGKKTKHYLSAPGFGLYLQKVFCQHHVQSNLYKTSSLAPMWLPEVI